MPDDAATVFASAPTSGAEPGAPSQSAWPEPGSTSDKAVLWFAPGPPSNLAPAARSLLEQHAGIPPAAVDARVEAIRERAWAVHPYPCIGRYRFPDFSLPQHPAYPRVLGILRGPASPVGDTPLLLDGGCCFGQDLRTALRDGVPAAQLRGAELRAAFVDLGHELFRDAETFPTDEHFVIGDVLDGARAFPMLQGTVAVLHAAAFLYLFDWDGQVEVASRLVGLLQDRPGVVMLGRDSGGTQPGYKRRTTEDDQKPRLKWRQEWRAASVCGARLGRARAPRGRCGRRCRRRRKIRCTKRHILDGVMSIPGG